MIRKEKEELPYINKDFYKAILEVQRIEYKSVAYRTLAPARILQAKDTKLTKGEIYSLIILICEDEEINAPKVKFRKNFRTAYCSVRNLIRINTSKDMDAHSVIHELTHHCTDSLIRALRIAARTRDRKGPSYHGRIFSIYQDYLLFEYQKYWIKL